MTLQRMVWSVVLNEGGPDSELARELEAGVRGRLRGWAHLMGYLAHAIGDDWHEAIGMNECFDAGRKAGAVPDMQWAEKQMEAKCPPAEK